jgi:hemerythrin
MRSIEWEEKYSVGIELIDNQHKVFIGILNDLYSAIINKKELSVLDDIFSQLVAYTHFHFQTEERYFDEFDYEGAEAHKIAHRALSDQVVAMQQKYDDVMKNPFELMDFLEDWLIEHIMGMDKLYSQCFKEHGLK